MFKLPLKLRKMFDFRDFHDIEKIIETIKDSKEFEGSEDNLRNAIPLLIFETSKQRNWLIISEFRIYCLLDDRNESNSRIKWSLEISKTLNIETSENFSQHSGVIIFDKDKICLFSKRLFTDATPTERILAIQTKKTHNQELKPLI